MPPPASPMSSRSTSLDRGNDGAEVAIIPDLELRGRMLQDQVSSSRPQSVTSVRSLAADDQVLIDQLQSRIDALEYDNERLRAANHISEANPTPIIGLETITQERDDALGQVTQLQTSLDDHRTRLSSLMGDHQQAIIALEVQKRDNENIANMLQKDLDEHAVLVQGLQATIDEQEIALQANRMDISKKDEEITSLNTRLESMSSEMQSETIDMGAQIDELRMAGQVSVQHVLLSQSLNLFSIGNHRIV